MQRARAHSLSIAKRRANAAARVAAVSCLLARAACLAAAPRSLSGKLLLSRLACSLSLRAAWQERSEAKLQKVTSPLYLPRVKRAKQRAVISNGMGVQ